MWTIRRMLTFACSVSVVMLGVFLGVTASADFALEYVVDSSSRMNPLSRRMYGVFGILLSIVVVSLPFGAWARASVSDRHPRWGRINAVLVAMCLSWWLVARLVPSAVRT